MENICKTVAQISNEYECNRSNLKKQYLLLNILLYNKIIQEIRHTIEGNVASFGTGYPFYALDRNFEWDLPVIKEQIHYNNELLEAAKNSQAKEWVCAQCLYQNSKFMPDLKQICKPCPNIEDELKPRKVINRLPDLDMWTVCDRNDIPIIKEYLQELFLKYGFSPSDINPLNTFEELYDILLMTGPDSVRRRHETPQLKRAFKERINSWKK